MFVLRMRRLILSAIFIVLLCNNNVRTARILGVFPFPSVSHQVVLKSLTDKLAERGHDLVIVTPNPVKENERKNIKEIDTSNTYNFLMKVWKQELYKIAMKRGVIADAESLVPESYLFFNGVTEMIFKHPEFQKILQDKSQEFDLIIAESMFPYPLVLTEIFRAPLIWFSSYYGTIENYHAVGAPYSHPFLYPHVYRNRILNLTLEEKFHELYFEYKLWNIKEVLLYQQNLIMKEHFPEVKKTVYELMDNVDMLFVNANPIFEGIRAVPPNVIFLGGLHMKPTKNLTKEWQHFVDSSQRGIVYISLGTNVHTAMMPPDLVEAFLGAIEALPYDVLWKFDGELPRKPKNLRVEKWFPQRDLLPHPKVKVFVTQGGLQSTDEAIDSGVPLVGIPMLGDQWYNVEQYVRLGIGLKVDSLTFQAEDLLKAVTTVIEDPSYRENIVRLRTLINDQPQTPLERAVWWTEYVIRHKGAKHLKALTANMSWWTYLEVELLSVVFGIFFGILVVLILSLLALKKLMCSLVCKGSREQNKNKKVKKS